VNSGKRVSREVNDGLPTALELWPDEFLAGWEASASRLFLRELAEAPLAAKAAIRITICGTGIAATVVGSVVATRRGFSRSLPAGGYLALPGRAAGTARYLERVALGLPVDYNERDPRYAVAWDLLLAAGPGRLGARTQNVSAEGCSLTWRGAVLTVGSWVTVRRRRLFSVGLQAKVCWSAFDDGTPCAGLHLETAGRAWLSWRTLVDREVRRGAMLL